MTVVTKLATININGITNRTRVGMLTEYIRRHDLDIIFLQEITDPELLTMPGYDVYYNIGSHRRGTAIVARNDIVLTNINKIPIGRAIVAEYKVCISSIYTPHQGRPNGRSVNTFTMPKYHNYYKPGMGNS